jgi:hypothetical protein
MNSDQCLNALMAQHSKDVCVPECKDGPTWTSAHSRLDLWTMRKSWTSPRVCGYEIKVSRADFVNDNKWQNYLPLCNELFFACPKGLIEIAEVPGNLGLVWCYPSGRAKVVKKAEHRAVQIPESLYRYLLMSRMRVDRNADRPTEDRLAIWREWLAARKEGGELGYRVSRAIREHVRSVEQKNEQLTKENETFAEVKRMMGEMGVNPAHWNAPDRVKHVLASVPPELERALHDSMQSLAEFKRVLDLLKGKAGGA